MTTYDAAAASLHFGAADFAVDLMPSLDSALVVAGSTTVDRRRRLTDAGDGLLGETADGITTTLQVSGTFLATPEVRTALAHRVGFLTLERTDAETMIAMACGLVARPLTSNPQGVVSYALRFDQRPARSGGNPVGPVAGRLYLAPAVATQRATTVGDPLYVRRNGSIAVAVAGAAQVEQAPGDLAMVLGPSIKGEGS